MIVWPHRLCGFGALGEATGSDHVDDSWPLHVEHLWVSIMGNLCSQTQEADRVVSLEWSLKACLPYSCDWAFCGQQDCDAGGKVLGLLASGPTCDASWLHWSLPILSFHICEVEIILSDLLLFPGLWMDMEKQNSQMQGRTILISYWESQTWGKKVS